jgi:CheY-like chemotaxis protein
MYRIICFSDSPAIIHAVSQGLDDGEHTLQLLPASRLTNELRQAVHDFAPDLILLEMSHAMDNPHIYFFLRADDATRETPVILVSNGVRLDQQAEILGADGFLQRPFAAEQLQSVVSPFLTPLQALAA